MKTHVAVLALIAAATLPSALGDGQMTFPPPRDVAPLRDRCYVGTDLTEMATGSIEKLETKLNRKATLFDNAGLPQFDRIKNQCGLRNRCRGTAHDKSRSAVSLHAQANPTVLEYDTAIPVAWDILAPAPGFMEIAIVTPSKGNKLVEVRYKKALALKKISNFGEQTGPGSTTIKIPSAFPWCEEEGACALWFHWRSDSTNQTFDTCADFTMNPIKFDPPTELD